MPSRRLQLLPLGCCILLAAVGCTGSRVAGRNVLGPERMLRIGQTFEKQGNLSAAKYSYERALVGNSENSEAQSRLNSVIARLDQPEPGLPPMDRIPGTETGSVQLVSLETEAEPAPAHDAHPIPATNDVPTIECPLPQVPGDNHHARPARKAVDSAREATDVVEAPSITRERVLPKNTFSAWQSGDR